MTTLDKARSFVMQNKLLSVGILIGIIFLIGVLTNTYSTEKFTNLGQFPIQGVDAKLGSQYLSQGEASEVPIPTLESPNLAPIVFNATGNELSPDELFPKSQVAADFEQQFPVGTGDLSAKNFLTAGFNVGINTVSSSLKNANYQLRSDPYIPVDTVGPWQQSTNIPDLNRKQFEIGTTA